MQRTNSLARIEHYCIWNSTLALCLLKVLFHEQLEVNDPRITNIAYNLPHFLMLLGVWVIKNILVYTELFLVYWRNVTAYLITLLPWLDNSFYFSPKMETKNVLKIKALLIITLRSFKWERIKVDEAQERTSIYDII